MEMLGDNGVFYVRGAECHLPSKPLKKHLWAFLLLFTQKNVFAPSVLKSHYFLKRNLPSCGCRNKGDQAYAKALRNGTAHGDVQRHGTSSWI